MKLEAALVGALCLAAACSSEPLRLEEQATRGRLAPLSALVLNAAPADFEAGAECVRVDLREYQERGWKAVALVARQDGRTRRRLLVAVDSANALRRFSDVRFGSNAVFVEAHPDASSGGSGFVYQAESRLTARGSADEILDAPNLGVPRQLANLVRQRCAYLLRAG